MLKYQQFYSIFFNKKQLKNHKNTTLDSRFTKIVNYNFIKKKVHY